MDNQEKITLTAEIEAINSQILTAEQIADIAKESTADYQALLSEIKEKYDAKVKASQDIRDDAVIAAKQAIVAAEAKFEEEQAAADADKEKLEAEAKAYYEQLKERDAATVKYQASLSKALEEKKARLAEIEAEEARIRAEEAARIKAAAEAQRAASFAQPAARPKIRF